MKFKINYCVVLLGHFAVAACGSDSDSNPTSHGDDPSKPSSFYQAVVASQCERAFECADSAPEGYEPPASVEACLAAWNDEVGTAGAEADAAAAAGRIAWNVDDAAYCLEQLTAEIDGYSCETFWELSGGAAAFDDPRCEGLGAGTVANGGTCADDEECADESADCVDDICTVQ